MSIEEILPPEILGKIFLHCLEDDFKKKAGTLVAPMLLCQVCSRWRDTALGMGELWTKLHLRISLLVFIAKTKGEQVEYTDRYIRPKTQDFVNWWICNLGQHLLTLSIHLVSERRGYHHEDGYKLATTVHICDIESMTDSGFFSGRLIRHSTRVLELEFHDDDFRMLSSLQSPTFTNLEYLTLHTYIDSGFIRYKQMYSFPPAPLLHRLHLTSARGISSFPCAQLTHLCISSSIRLDQFQKLLKVDCPNLKYGGFSLEQALRWDEDGDTDDGRDQVQIPTAIPSLRQMTISCHSINNSSPFDDLIFPSLTSLRLASTYSQPVDDIKHLFDVLKATPNIIELRIQSELLCRRKPFSPGPSTSLGAFLPHLKLLVLEIHDLSDRNGPEILRLAQSTWFRPSLSVEGTRVEIVFHHLPYGEFGGGPTKAEDDLIEEIQSYYDREELPFSHAVYRSDQGRWSWSQVSKDLGRWDEAMGFNEIVV